MGIFTVPTISVRKTRIYVSPSLSHPLEQLTVYKNEVNTLAEGGFMILPVPYPRTLRFYVPRQPYPPHHSPYLNFLDKVERAFDVLDRRHTFPRPRDPQIIGSYHTEVIDTIDELRALNESEHFLHERTMDQLADIYKEPYWGFILCSLMTGSYVYEPLCYSHRMLHDELFIPALTFQPRTYSDTHIPEEFPGFDDRYFMNGCYYSEPMGYRLQEVNPQRVSSIPWNDLPPDFQQCKRYFLSESRQGHHWNSDSFYRINESVYTDYHPSQRRISDDLY